MMPSSIEIEQASTSSTCYSKHKPHKRGLFSSFFRRSRTGGQKLVSLLTDRDILRRGSIPVQSQTTPCNQRTDSTLVCGSLPTGLDSIVFHAPRIRSRLARQSGDNISWTVPFAMGRDRDLERDMERLRLSRHDNPLVHERLTSYSSIPNLGSGGNLTCHPSTNQLLSTSMISNGPDARSWCELRFDTDSPDCGLGGGAPGHPRHPLRLCVSNRPSLGGAQSSTPGPDVLEGLHDHLIRSPPPSARTTFDFNVKSPYDSTHTLCRSPNESMSCVRPRIFDFGSGTLCSSSRQQPYTATSFGGPCSTSGIQIMDNHSLANQTNVVVDINRTPMDQCPLLSDCSYDDLRCYDAVVPPVEDHFGTGDGNETKVAIVATSVEEKATG